jgi:hypothetical protein
VIDTRTCTHVGRSDLTFYASARDNEQLEWSKLPGVRGSVCCLVSHAVMNCAGIFGELAARPFARY